MDELISSIEINGENDWKYPMLDILSCFESCKKYSIGIINDLLDAARGQRDQMDHTGAVINDIAIPHTDVK